MFFEKFAKISTKEYGINPLYFVSLPGYTYQCALKCTDTKVTNTTKYRFDFVIRNYYTWRYFISNG